MPPSVLMFLIISLFASLNAEEANRLQVTSFVLVSSFGNFLFGILIYIFIQNLWMVFSFIDIFLHQILSFGGNGNIGSAVLSRILDTMEADITVCSRWNMNG